MSGPINELIFKMIHFGHLIIESLPCNICIFSERFLYMPFPDLIVTNFPIQCFPYSLPIFQTVDSADLHFWPSLSPDCTSQSLTSWENFPSLMSSDHYCAAVHFLFVLGYYGTNFKVHLSFFFIHLVIRNSPMMLDTDWRKKKQCLRKESHMSTYVFRLAQAQYLV